MSNRPNHRESEQEVLNEARNSTYGAIDVIPQVETSAGVTSPVGYQAPLPAKIINTDGTDNSLTAGGVYGQKVHVVGDSDKYVRGNIAHDAVDSASDPVNIGGTAASSTPSAVAAGDRVRAYFDTTGHQHVKVDAITATDLDIRDLTATDVVTANLSATDNAVLDDIAAKVNNNLDGTGTHGTRDLTSANTWYAVPSTVPTAAYVLIAQPRAGNAGTIRWSFLNSGTPGAGTGLEIQGDLILRLAANESVVFASSTAGDDVDWTCKEIV